MSAAPAPADECCLAVDVGGTKMAAGVVDRNGTLRWSARCPTPRSSDGDTVFAALAALLDAASVAADRGTSRLVACGIGCGGPMHAMQHVSPLNIPAWRAYPLVEKVAAHTGLPTAMDNDAKALALAEGWRGGARGSASYMAMVVSTGVGGGVVLDGRLLDGATGNAGHVGHVVVEPGGRRCACGGRGCLEAEASGTAIAAVTGRPAADAPVEVRRRVGQLVGRAVACVVNLLDLPLVLVAGSVALGYGDDFFDAAAAELRLRSTIAYAVGAQVLPAALGADGPLVGAAAVGWRAAGTPFAGPPFAGMPFTGPPIAGPPVAGPPVGTPPATVPVGGVPVGGVPVGGVPVGGVPVGGVPVGGVPVGGVPVGGVPVGRQAR